MSMAALSTQHRIVRPAPKLSEFIFGIDWSKHFPLTLSADEQIEVSDYETAAQFYQQHYSTIYANSREASPFLSQEYSEAKKRYYQTAGDFFAFKHKGKTTGIFVGTPIDWASYYFRSVLMLPEHQGGKHYQSLLLRIIEILKAAGVQRVEADIAPSNLKSIHVINKLQFNATGMNLSERWGAQMHFTKFLDERYEAIFLSQFCEGVWPQTDRSNIQVSPKGQA